MAEAGTGIDVGAGPAAAVDLGVDRGFDLGVVGVDLDLEVVADFDVADFDVADFDLDVVAFVFEPDAGSGFAVS